MKKYVSKDALSKIRKVFPQVETVRDADKNILIEVTKKDSDSSTRKNPEQCALAHACMRKKIADGAIVGVSFTWLIKGTVATRYSTSIGVAREITSFDRHHEFAEGKDYLLSAVSPMKRLGADRGRVRSPGDGSKSPKTKRTVHRTTNIRTVS